jgi:hypothetical protein
MNLHNRCVDHGIFHVRLIRAGLKKFHENIGFQPIALPFESRVPIAEQIRQIAPRTACAGNPKNRLDEAAIVAAATTGIRWLAKAVRLHP